MHLMAFPDQIRDAGVVGAGGGGFPTHVKLDATADTVIANGAECEPLLYKDAVVMEHNAVDLVRGMQLAMEAVGAKDGIIGIKAKKKEAVAAAEAACKGTPVRVQLLGDYYPSGDEYDLVYETTGRLIPPKGIPLQIGVVVMNVETIINAARAADGLPVTHKTLTIAGAVHNPITINVPIGTPYRDAITLAGGLACDDAVLCLGGLMMGSTTEDLDTPITKLSTGVVVLPREHHLIQRKLKPADRMNTIGKSSCDQCRFCTEFCPRYLLGYQVEPHQVMRTLAFTATGADYFNKWADLCCSCGLCTLYACPEELYPKEACDQSKTAMRESGDGMTQSPETLRAHPMRDGRHTPIPALVRKLDVGQYDVLAPLIDVAFTPSTLHIPLKQHAGAPAQPVVVEGETVDAGQLCAQIPDGQKISANIHASLAGTVSAVSADTIVITTM
jgi:Na+-translocating ferredoxin:NAD+ oxidoreductase RnfC subunit